MRRAIVWSAVIVLVVLAVVVAWQDCQNSHRLREEASAKQENRVCQKEMERKWKETEQSRLRIQALLQKAQARD